LRIFEASIGHRLRATTLENGHGQSKLGKQPTDIPLQKGDGHKHRDEHQRGGNDRKTYLTGPSVGGHQGGFPSFIHAPVDIFQHDNGIIDDQPDGQNQGQQGEQID